MREWLNDTTVDGFLGNLREPEKFIKMNSVWNATMSLDTSKPAKTTLVTDAIGLLNLYEYTMSYKNATIENGYLANGFWWWTLTPTINEGYIYYIGNYYNASSTGIYPQAGIRPAINLKGNIKIISGNGTINSPYRLEGDNDEVKSGTLLSSRYSGEYISFGTGENNLYRIVSHEKSNETKIVSNVALKDTTTIFDNSTNYYSKDTLIGQFLNNTYLNSGNYLTKDEVNMISDNSVWYLGTAFDKSSYKLAKYNADNIILTENVTSSKVGLLRYGELMSGISDINEKPYFLLTRYDNNVRFICAAGFISDSDLSNAQYIKPAMNLKSNVVITGGDGTKSNPFTIKLNN